MSNKCILGKYDPCKKKNLYVFPHSGGMPGSYMQWKTHLPDVNVFGVQYPGRGSRITEGAHESIPEIVADIIKHQDFKEEIYFFGHSLGSIIAYEVGREIQKTHVLKLLIVSAMSGPGFGVIRKGTSELSSEELLEEMMKLNPSILEALQDNVELKEMFVDVLRADLKAAEAYSHIPGDQISAPILCLGGKDDRISTAEYNDWGRMSKSKLLIKMFDGGHFYFNHDLEGFLKYLSLVLHSPSKD